MKSRILAASITLFAFGIRISGILSQSLWRDEVDAIIFASVPWREALRYFTHPGWNGPLYYLLLKGWLSLTGKGEFALRYFSLLFGVLSLPLTFKLARKFLPARLTLIAMLLTGLSPYLVWYSREGKMYGLWLALSLLAFILHIEALEKGGTRYWILYLLAMAANFYVHFHTLFMILGQLALYLWHRKRWKEGLLVHSTLILPLVPAIRWLVPAFLSHHPTGFPFYPLPDMLSILFTGWSCGILSSLWPWALIPAGIAGLGGILAREKGLPLITILLLPTLGLFGVCLRKPVFTDRYLIFLAPFFYMLLSSGLGFWRVRGKPFELALLLALVSVDAEANLSQSRFPIKSDFRAAVALFKEYARDGDVVVFQIPYVRRVFDYYLAGERSYIPVEGPYTNWGMSPAQVDAYLRSYVGHTQRVWLVLSEAEMWDSRGLTEGWFKENFSPELRGHFTRVTMTLYSRPEPLVDLRRLRYKCFLPLVLR